MFHDKTVQSNILWLNVIKIGGRSILQSAHKQGNPSFHVHAPGSKRRDTHVLKQHRLSKNIFPVCSSFVLVITSDMHLESQSKKNERKTFIFIQLKISRYNPHFYAIFRRILIK